MQGSQKYIQQIEARKSHRDNFKATYFCEKVEMQTSESKKSHHLEHI